MVGAIFRKPVHQVLEKVKNESFFKWLNKMVGNPEKRNRKGKLKQLLHHSSGLGGQTNSWTERETPSRPPLGTINIIFAAPGRTGSCPSRVMSMARLSSEDICHEPKRARLEWPLVIGFLDEDKIGTIQPHDDALVIAL